MTNQPPGAMIGQSAAIAQLIEEAGFVSSTDFNVLLTGETGVGKRSFAKFMHENSPRRKRQMLSRNCARDSALFGDDGLLEKAHGGTLLLVDVEEMEQRTQAQLHRFLEKSDVRILSATNRNLLQRASEQAFCIDLYYRLNVVHLEIPPLRERREDVACLLGYYLKKFSQEFHLALCELAPSALSALEAYSWPGNIRELREIAQLLALTHPGRVVAVEQLHKKVLAPRVSMPSIEADASGRQRAVRARSDEPYRLLTPPPRRKAV